MTASRASRGLVAVGALLLTLSLAARISQRPVPVGDGAAGIGAAYGCTAGDGAAGIGAAGIGAVAAPGAWRVRLNSATTAELSLLPGVGPALAARIAESRRELGPFAALESLERVRGVGPGLVERIRPYAEVGSRASRP